MPQPDRLVMLVREMLKLRKESARNDGGVLLHSAIRCPVACVVSVGVSA